MDDSELPVDQSNTIETVGNGGRIRSNCLRPSRWTDTLKEKGECNVTFEPSTFEGREIDLYATPQLLF